jgi:hypothetical protein
VRKHFEKSFLENTPKTLHIRLPAMDFILHYLYELRESRNSSFGAALGYGLDDRGSRDRFPAGAGNYSLHHRVQTGSGPRLATYPVGLGGSFPGDKAAGA